MANTKQKTIIRFKDSAFPDQLRDLLLQSGKVKVQGVGVFTLKRFPPKTAYNVKKLKYYTRPAYVKVSFKPTISLKDEAQKYGA